MTEEHRTLYPTDKEIEAIREFKARYGPYGFESTYPTERRDGFGARQATHRRSPQETTRRINGLTFARSSQSPECGRSRRAPDTRA